MSLENLIIMKKLYYRFRLWQVGRKRSKAEPKMISHVKINGKRIWGTRISNSTVLNDKHNLNLANNIFIGHFNFIEASNGITIEEGVQITNYCSILTHSSHISIRLYGKEYDAHYPLVGYKTGAVHIGKFTFVGPHVTILPGSSIGKGCMISAYSLIKGEIPDFSIVKGNPGVVVGDTRDLDKPFLEEHPELLSYYNQWAK